MAHRFVGGLAGRLTKTLLVLCAALLSSAPALSQAPPPNPSEIDERAVDLLSGKVIMAVTDIAIGPNDHHGLSFSRQWAGEGWQHSMVPTMSGSTTNPVVSFRGKTVPFKPGTGGYVPVFEDGSRMSSDRSTFTASDGTVVLFGYAGQTEWNSADNSLGVGTKITYPDGTVWNFHYQFGSYGNVQWWCDEYGCVPYGDTYYISRLSSITSSMGYQIKLTYALNTIDASTYHLWSQISKATAINNAVEYCDPNANSCSLSGTWPEVTYSNWLWDQIASATGPESRTTTYSYSTSTGLKLTGIRPPGASANTVVYGYGGTPKVTDVTVNGSTWLYSYATAGSTSTTTVTNPVSQARTIEYTPERFVTKVTEGGLSTNFGYCSGFAGCPYGLLQTIIRPEGNYTTYTYDDRGNTTSVTETEKPTSGFATLVTSATYAPTCTTTNQKTCNKPTSTTDAKTKTTNYQWIDAHGGLDWVKAPADASGIRPETRISYTGYQAYYKNSGGSIVASGITTYLPTQTASCRTLASCTGGTDERKTVIAYGPQSAGTGNNLNAVTATTSRGDGALAATTTMTYDNYGRVQTVDGPLSADTARIRYNLAGQVIGKVSPDPDDGGSSKHPAQRITYNSWGQAYLVENGTTNGLTDGDIDSMTVSTKTALEIDGYGRPVRQWTRDASNNNYQAVDTIYDPTGRVLCTLTRMDMSNISLAGCQDIQTTGANGPDRVTYNHYDALGRVWKVTSGYGTSGAVDDQVVLFTNNGVVSSVIDARGNRTGYEYDGFDRRLKTIYPNSTAPGSYNPSTSANALSTSSTPTGGDYEQVGYDANGNVTSFRTRRSETLYSSYDNLNRLVLKDVPLRSGLASTHTRDVYYAYDLFGGMIYARYDNASGEGVTNYYDALGRNTGSTLGMDGVARTLVYDYNAAGGLIRLTHQSDGNYFNYNRSASGSLYYTDVNNASMMIHPTANAQAVPMRLHRWNTAGAAWDSYTHFSYNSLLQVNGITNEFAGTGNDVSTSFSYNPAGQITSTSRSNDAFAWTGAVNVNRSYTSNGLNQYSAVAGTSFTHDGNGNLTSDGTNSFVYDVENRLVSRSGGASATMRYDPLGRLYEVVGSATTRFLYDGSDLVAEYDGSNNLLRRYVHGLGGGDDPQVWFEGSSVADSVRRYLYSDERGSVIAVTNGSGSVLNLNSYDEYGIPAAGNNGRFQYTGQAWIPELGMYYYKARMYSPTIGRFMQTDPIGYGDGMNMYAYVANDPVNSTDPSGTKCRADGSDDGMAPVCVPIGAIEVIGNCGTNCDSMSLGQFNSSYVSGFSGALYASGSQSAGATLAVKGSVLEQKRRNGTGKRGEAGKNPNPNKHGPRKAYGKPGYVTDEGRDGQRGRPRPARPGEPGYGEGGSDFSTGDVVAGVVIVAAVVCFVAEPCGAIVAAGLGLGGGSVLLAN